MNRSFFLFCIVLFAMLNTSLFSSEVTIDLNAIQGKTFGEAFQILMDLGFFHIAPVPVQNDAPKETVLGLKINGQAVKGDQKYSTDYSVKVMVSMGSEDIFEKRELLKEKISDNQILPPSLPPVKIRTDALEMTGLRAHPIKIETAVLEMTGLRAQSLAIQTDSLLMTGMRIFPLQIQTAALEMTGLRQQSIFIRTAALEMTGLRPHPISLKTEPLVMTGLRGEVGIESYPVPADSISSDKKVPDPSLLQRIINKKKNQ